MNYHQPKELKITTCYYTMLKTLKYLRLASEVKSESPEDIDEYMYIGLGSFALLDSMVITNSLCKVTLTDQDVEAILYGLSTYKKFLLTEDFLPVEPDGTQPLKKLLLRDLDELTQLIDIYQKLLTEK